MTEDITNLATALAQAQAEMGSARKDGKNPHFRSTFATLASVVEAVKGPLANHGLAYVQMIHSEDGKVGIETRLYHGAESLTSPILWLPYDNQKGRSTAQAIGSAITYGRRYQLMAMLGIPQEDDDGNDAGRDGRAAAREQARAQDRGNIRLRETVKLATRPANQTKAGNVVAVGAGEPIETDNAKEGDIWVDCSEDPARVLRADGEGDWDELMPEDAPYRDVHETLGAMLKDQAKKDRVSMADLCQKLQAEEDTEAPVERLSQVSVSAMARVYAEMECPI